MKKTSLALLLTLPLAISAFAEEETGPAAPATGTPLSSARFQASPFTGVCEDVALLSNGDYQRNKDYWDQAIAQCGVSVQVLPETGFFNTMRSRLGEAEDNTRAREFLQRVGQRTLENIDFNNKVTELWIHCANNDHEWIRARRESARAQEAQNPDMARFDIDFYDESKCEERLSQLQQVIRQKGSPMRVAREMMRHTASAGNVVASGLRSLFGTDLPGERVELSAEERQEVERTKTQLETRINQSLQNDIRENLAKVEEIKRRNPSFSVQWWLHPDAARIPQWFREWNRESNGGQSTAGVGARQANLILDRERMGRRGAEFGKYFRDYSNALGDARILAYLDSRDPDKASIARAAQRLLENGQRTRRETADLVSRDRDSRGRPISDEDRAKNLMTLMQNGPVVRDLLREDPTQCRAAAGLANYASNVRTRNGVLVGTGLFVGGIVTAGVGPAVFGAVGLSVSAAAISTTIGVVSGAVSVGMDYQAYQRAQRRTFNYAHNVDGNFGAGRAVAELGDFQEARNAFVINAAITLASTTASVVPPMYRRFFEENASRYQTQVVLKRLMDPVSAGGGGLTEAQAKQLLRDIGSTDREAARDAITRVARVLGVDQGELRTFQQMVSKQLLDPAQSSQFQQYSQRLRALPREQREQVYGRMQALMGELNAANVGPAKRADAMRVVLAASEFGVDDPRVITQAARHINSWDEGLYGLARAYDQARANMQLPEIARLAPELRREAAFRRALEQLGVAEQAQQAAMTACAIGGAR